MLAADASCTPLTALLLWQFKQTMCTMTDIIINSKTNNEHSMCGAFRAWCGQYTWNLSGLQLLRGLLVVPCAVLLLQLHSAVLQMHSA